MTDEALTQRLVQLCADADLRHPVTETVDSWARADPNGRLAEVKAVLLRDPTIAAHAAPGNFLFVAGSSGWGCDLDGWLAGFVREADPLSEEPRSREAERFVSALRLQNGTAPIHVRTTLAGVKLDDDLIVNLPFGRLRPAVAADFSAEHLTELPPAAVFEYEAELPARFAANGENPFVGDDAASVVQQVEERHDDVVARVLIALTLAGEGPVQEHMTMRAPRYVGGGTGINPIPLAPTVVSYPYYLAEGPRLAELVQVAKLIAEIPIGRLGVVVRRYLMALTERTRPADQIIDYSVAFEALTATGNGPKQAQRLAALIGEMPAFYGTVEDRHKLVKDARNAILHDGKTPPDAATIASTGRTLVRLGLHGAVREAIASAGPSSK